MARLANVPPPANTPRAIAENLTGVLNSRKGFGAVVPELGLGDFFSRRGTHGATEVLRDELQANIERLEPRLQRPEVSSLGEDADFWLHFDVRGTADGTPVHLIVSFQTTLGAVRVRVV